MDVSLRIAIICGLIVTANTLDAAQDRGQIINEALDRIEHRLNGGGEYQDIVLGESKPEIAYITIEEEIVYSYEPAYSEEPDYPVFQIDPIQKSSPLTNFEWGLETFHHRYKEPGIMKQDGMLYGLQASYTARTSFFNKDVDRFRDHFGERDKLNMFKVEGMAAFGSVDFESETIGNHKGRENFIAEIRGLAGYDFPVVDDLLLTPYVGIGYRYLKDRSPGRILPFTSFSGAFSFERVSTYFYVPFGMTMTKMMQSGWTMELSMEYDLLLRGSQKNDYSDGGFKVIDIEGNTFVLDALDFKQEEGFGIRGSTKFFIEKESVGFFVEPYFRYWKIRDSETKQFTSGSILWFDSTLTVRREGNQPANSTTEIGLKLGLHY